VIKDNIRRLVWVALVAPIAVLAAAAPASAEKEHHPTGDYSIFEQCPTENPEINICSFAEAHGGEFQIGNLSIPITKPIVLQSGLNKNEETFILTALPATNGETLVKATQVVSGGIFAVVKEGRYPWYLRNFCKNFPNNSECKVTATAEIVGQAHIDLGDIISAQDTALEIPLRFHLKNPFLGGKCYIGTASTPATIAYTTGSKPPLGVEPELIGIAGTLEGIEKDEDNIVVLRGSELVDNAFSAPTAEGCGGPQSLIVDREIDEKQGLPAPAGHSRSRLVATMSIALPSAVLESES
jgi:hypothetical protein